MKIEHLEDLSLELDLDSLAPQQKRVKLNGKKYVLCEADAETARRYKNMSSASAKFSETGKCIAFENPADVEMELVAGCLWVADDNWNQGKTRLHISEIKKIGYTKVKPLFDLAKKMSGLVEEEETVELLEKRIEMDTKKLEQLRKEDPSKNGHGSTQTYSDSAESGDSR